MSRIRELIGRLRARDEAALAPFLVLGDPDPATSLDLMGALVEGGADFLELGLPFSDPPADGPVVQAADGRALAAGTTTGIALDLIAEASRRWGCPVSLLVYYNLVLARGVERFYADAARAGVDAVLVADVPLEESGPIRAAARAAGVAPMLLVSELTGEARLARVAAAGDGFLYVVARVGTTGERAGLEPALPGLLARLRAATDLPAVVGFGVSTPEHVRSLVAAGADGVISGSAVVRRVADHLGRPAMMCAEVTGFVARMKAATRPGQEEPPCSS